MSQKDLLDQLIRHAEWADATVWQTVLGGEDDEPTPPDSKVEYWLHHIHLVQHAWVSVWHGQAPELKEIGDFDGARAIARWGRESHAEIQRFLGETGDAELDRELEIPWTEELNKRWDRPISPVSVAQSAAQVALHSTHHRGQVTARLRETGAEPPMVDYIAWVWFGEPEAQWPVVQRPESDF